MAPMEHTLMVYSPSRKDMVYERFFFEVVMVMVRDKKKYIMEDTMSINTSFMRYMKWIRVTLPVIFEEFELEQ